MTMSGEADRESVSKDGAADVAPPPRRAMKAAALVYRVLGTAITVLVVGEALAYTSEWIRRRRLYRWVGQAFPSDVRASRLEVPPRLPPSGRHDHRSHRGLLPRALPGGRSQRRLDDRGVDVAWPDLQ
jgi:hypothetical protein